MRGRARRTTASVWGRTYDIRVVQTGKVTWMAYGDVTFKDMEGKEVTEHVSEKGRSEGAAIRHWERMAAMVMDY